MIFVHFTDVAGQDIYLNGNLKIEQIYSLGGLSRIQLVDFFIDVKESSKEIVSRLRANGLCD